MKETVKVAVIQDSSIPFDATATTKKACNLIREAAENGAELALFPEAFVGTYPKGLNFDAPVGKRLPEGREDFLRYFNNAVEIDGTEVAQLVDIARECGIFVVIGVIERDGFTLYCTALYIDPQKGLVGKHRKVMPSGSERLIWGFGDGSTLEAVSSNLGKLGAVICWENYMPAVRLAMYDQNVEIYLVPTADDRDTWLPTMRHIAVEGRCYVLSACQYIQLKDFGPDYRSVLSDDPEAVVMRGGSTIISPLGEVIEAPVFNERTILYATLDNASLIRSKFDFDPVGHYSRADLFSLHMDVSVKEVVTKAPSDPASQTSGTNIYREDA
ncbi:carbon-nitrogen hydrolase family protein [Ruegeria profundi]|uniref:Nitrilase n=1 Tax=Ruegeria profundi TaxID=1685378 RepID=A0A0X3TRY2_9RHOB|nr:carbon-nitrogen hydrolase family protein [Ruegeria profundi]KUJ78482.1 nitrilase [Ruegeria profundi]